MPMHREDGSVLGAVGGALKLQSQSLLPPSMAFPERDDSRLVVFSRDGTILSHSDPTQVLGNVRDEAGCQRCMRSGCSKPSRWWAGITQVMPDHIVSMAGMPLPSGWLPGSVTRALCWRRWRVRNAMHGGPWPVSQRWRRAAGAAAGVDGATLARLRWLHSNCCRAKPGADAVAPGAGEVGDLVQALERLARQGSQHANNSPRWAASFRRFLDHASVGIVITRLGVLEVVGRQTCLMLGYTLPNCKASPAHHLRLF